MQKFGSKALHGAAKFGSKATHNVAKFGSKTIVPAATLAAIAAPEIAVPLEVGAMLGKPLLKSIQKSTR
tara:strand:- start:1274 stop:1480 length:207 start_codon:yes stop_codon:yes gene_type:complete